MSFNYHRDQFRRVAVPAQRSGRPSDGGCVAFGMNCRALAPFTERARQPMSYAEGCYWLTYNGEPTLLRVFDRASMAQGIEVGMPFMDWQLAPYSFALPEASKIGGGYTKRVRLAMQGMLPEPIRLRTQKIGFVAPMDKSASGAMKQWLLDLVGAGPLWKVPSGMVL
jgi:asparagine synthetase B (glutamine-hydrolysing)